MYNQQYYNPAAVGSRGTGSFTGIHRSQWLGFDGAPNTSALSFQTPFMRQRAGIGGMVYRHQVGITKSWVTSAAYSYNVKLTPDWSVRLGLQAVLRYMGIDFDSDEVVVVSQNDPSITNGEFTESYRGNIGAGMHLSFKKLFYLGVSSPMIYPNELGINPETVKTAKVFPHRYLMLGAVVPVTPQLELMPNLLMKWVDHAPLDAEINMMLRYMQKITGGLTYRAGGVQAGDSVDALLFFQFDQKIGAGISYDLTLSKIREYQSGTIEVVVRYDLKDEKSNLENPRYFKKK
jgi:type IX secretion system PorP/SprF family membrane protein